MTRCAPDRLCCGPFVAGEIPDPLVYRFLNADGSPKDLTGYTASFCWAERWGAAGGGDASITDAPDGEVTYTWAAGDLATPGRMTGQLWVEQAGGARYASVPIAYDVHAGVCAA